MRFIFTTRSLFFLFFFSAVSCKNSKTVSTFQSNNSSDNLSPTIIEACSLNESSESVINVHQPLGGYTTRTKNNIKFEFRELVSPYEVTAASFSKAGNQDLLVSYLSKQDKVIIQKKTLVQFC